jgi:hypothetical protein
VQRLRIVFVVCVDPLFAASGKEQQRYYGYQENRFFHFQLIVKLFQKIIFI